MRLTTTEAKAIKEAAKASAWMTDGWHNRMTTEMQQLRDAGIDALVSAMEREDARYARWLSASDADRIRIESESDEATVEMDWKRIDVAVRQSASRARRLAIGGAA